MDDALMTSNDAPEGASSKVANPQPAKAVDDQLIEELVGRAQAEGLQLTGEGGLLQQLRNDCWSRLWRARPRITPAMTGMIRQVRTTAPPATDPATKRC